MFQIGTWLGNVMSKRWLDPFIRHSTIIHGEIVSLWLVRHDAIFSSLRVDCAASI